MVATSAGNISAGQKLKDPPLVKMPQTLDSRICGHCGANSIRWDYDGGQWKCYTCERYPYGFGDVGIGRRTTGDTTVIAGVDGYTTTSHNNNGLISRIPKRRDLASVESKAPERTVQAPNPTVQFLPPRSLLTWECTVVWGDPLSPSQCLWPDPFSTRSRIINLLFESSVELSRNQIATELGLSGGRTNYLLSQLEQEGMAARSQGTWQSKGRSGGFGLWCLTQGQTRVHGCGGQILRSALCRKHAKEYREIFNSEPPTWKEMRMRYTQMGQLTINYFVKEQSWAGTPVAKIWDVEVPKGCHTYHRSKGMWAAPIDAFYAHVGMRVHGLSTAFDIARGKVKT